MLNPKDVLTESGYHKLYNAVSNIEYALMFIIAHADDLHIGALDESQLETLYKMQEMVSGKNPVLLHGDGEKDDE